MGQKQTSEVFSLEALRAGDRSEFARLVETYSTPVYRIALRIVSDPTDAEDVLQETFLKAFNAIRLFEGRSSLATWLYRIATNEALMVLRKRKPVSSIALSDDYDDDEDAPVAIQLIDWGNLPETELLSNESHQALEQAVQRLSPALRVVFVLRDIQELSVRETAQVLEISEEAVKTRLLRARLRLREFLSQYYGERIAPGGITEQRNK